MTVEFALMLGFVLVMLVVMSIGLQGIDYLTTWLRTQVSRILK